MHWRKKPLGTRSGFPHCGAAVYAYSLMFLSRNHRKLADMSETDARLDTPPLSWSELGMIGQLPIGTVTLLLADIEGST